MSGSVNASSNKGSSSTSATRKPILSDQWIGSWGNAESNLNPGGYTPDQQIGADWLKGNLNNNPINGATDAANWNLGQGMNDLAFLNGKIAPFVDQAPRQAEYAGDVTAKTGADFMGAYNNPWQKDVIDSSVADYNASTDRSLNAMRAGRDAAGAFGDRGAIADAVFNADASRGLGALTSGLRAQGFNTAAGFGQTDASRFLAADQANQMARAQNNQFNVNAGYQGDQQRMQATQNIVQNGLARLGLSQQQIGNVVTANGINTDAAKSLFNAGGISQSQLTQLLSLAQAANGDQATGTSNSSSKSKGGSSSGTFGGS